MINVVFGDVCLGLDDDPSFALSRYVDFVIAGEDVLIAEKLKFESVMNYKQAHGDEFL